MKFIKKHKSLIVIVLMLIAVLAALILLKTTVMFDENQAIYGDRLDGSEKVKLTTDQIGKAEDEVKESIKSISIKQRGKIISIIVYAKEDVALADAKEIGNKVLTVFTAEQKKFFDFEIFIQNEGNQDQFPIIGYKHQDSEGISWTRDRVKAEG